MRPSATGASSSYMFGRADAEADADRQVSLRAEPADVIDQVRRQGGAFARDAGDRDVVEKAGRSFGNANGPFARRGGRHELDEADVALAANGGQLGRFFDRQVGHDEAGQAAIADFVNVFLESVAIHDRVADHRDERRFNLRRDFAERIQDVGELDFVCERAGVRRLNHGAIGDRIAVGNADFAQMAAAADHFFQHRGGEREIGIAGRDERHQRFALLAAEVRE